MSAERCTAVDDYGMGRCVLDAHDSPSHAYEHVPGPPGPPQRWESVERVAAKREALGTAEVAWRLVYEDGGWNTFDTDPKNDAGRALGAFLEDRAAGLNPRLLCRFGGVWFTLSVESACSECHGKGVTRQGRQYGPCATCRGQSEASKRLTMYAMLGAQLRTRNAPDCTKTIGHMGPHRAE